MTVVTLGARGANEKAGWRRLRRVLLRTLAQRWRALKRGLDLQITNTLPRRRTTLQSRWRDLADFSEERTFMTVPGWV